VAYRSSRGRFRSISIPNNVEYVSGGSPGLLPGCLTELPDPLRYVRPQEEAPVVDQGEPDAQGREVRLGVVPDREDFLLPGSGGHRHPEW
jgi:hypothetical protein